MAILRRYSAGCALGLVLGSLALPAMAEPPASNNGLMSFPNVRVESAPAPANSAKAPAVAAQQPGMKAYLDSSGKLTEPSAAQAANLNHQAPLLSRNSTTASIAAAAAEPEIIYGVGNTEMVALDEQSMVFSVVHKGPDGKLTQQCVTGETQANHALHAHSSNDQHEGSRNDR